MFLKAASVVAYVSSLRYAEAKGLVSGFGLPQVCLQVFEIDLFVALSPDMRKSGIRRDVAGQAEPTVLVDLQKMHRQSANIVL
jgi:hypothetical protein